MNVKVPVHEAAMCIERCATVLDGNLRQHNVHRKCSAGGKLGVDEPITTFVHVFSFSEPPVVFISTTYKMKEHRNKTKTNSIGGHKSRQDGIHEH